MKSNARVAVVTSRFNEDVTDALHKSALKELRRGGVPASRIKSVWVPGGFEIPWAAAKLAKSRRYDAVICLGCVLQGGTKQNHYISQAIYINLQKLSVDTGVPILVGVLTVDTMRQARARTRGDMDRGREAAEAALEVLNG